MIRRKTPAEKAARHAAIATAAFDNIVSSLHEANRHLDAEREEARSNMARHHETIALAREAIDDEWERIHAAYAAQERHDRIITNVSELFG